MILIFEGPDYSGKDYLIDKMSLDAPQYSTLYFHNSTYASQALAMKAFKRQLNIVDQVFNHTYGDIQVYFNRFHISSAIYGSIVRGENLMLKEYNEIENHLIKLNAQIILCLPPKNIVLKGWKSRIDEEYVKDEELISQVYDEYCKISNHTALPILKHDFTLGRYTE
jgi:thymidylate kinase